MFKHRKKQEKRHRTGEIPTGSFSDIAFLLIIYFLVATTLVKVKSISADLPSGEKQSDAAVDKTPIINLRGSKMFFSDKEVTLANLNARLAALKLAGKTPEQRVVMLESTSMTSYESYFQALAAISSNGGVVAIVEEEDSQ
ncbi:MAG: biopolymer transporter ExbD [Rubripirellula sp.]|nr:biopolymer transporter ExbD [Rubripirellula sp.]